MPEGIEAAARSVRLLMSRMEDDELWAFPHRNKSFSIFPSPAGMSVTKLSLGGNYDVLYKLFLPRESLVSDIQAGDGNIEKIFYGALSL